MTINYSVTASGRVVNYTVEGSPSPEEFHEFFDSVTCEPSFERGFAFLGDYRRMVSNPESGLFRTVASQLRAKAKELAPCKWASVFSTAGGFATVRVCSLLTHGTGIEFSPFLKLEDAAKWLGVKCSDAAQIGASPNPVDRSINYLLDMRRRPGSGLHPRVMRKPS